jgi:hypothetical protein
MLKGDETSETATDVATTDAEPVKSAYADTAVAQVSDSVNIRASADENSESLGKLYNNGIGTVLDNLFVYHQLLSCCICPKLLNPIFLSLIGLL